MVGVTSAVGRWRRRPLCAACTRPRMSSATLGTPAGSVSCFQGNDSGHQQQYVHCRWPAASQVARHSFFTSRPGTCQGTRVNPSQPRGHRSNNTGRSPKISKGTTALDCSSRLDSVAFLPYLLTYVQSARPLPGRVRARRNDDVHAERGPRAGRDLGATRRSGGARGASLRIGTFR